MKRPVRKLNPREVLLAAIAVIGVIIFPMFRWGILPAYHQWQSLRYSTTMQTMEYHRLRSNLSMRKSVGEQFEKLGTNIFQEQSDQITLSDYLRELEALARYPSLTVIGIKPLPVVNEKSHKTYRIKLSVAGKLPEILQFVAKVTNGPTVTGLEAFSLRGVQGANRVECSLSLRMVRLTAQDDNMLACSALKEKVVYGR